MFVLLCKSPKLLPRSNTEVTSTRSDARTSGELMVSCLVYRRGRGGSRVFFMDSFHSNFHVIFVSNFDRPKELDLFFTSVSAVTVSSMSTVEMEVFSNTQLVILTILMLVGGEVFTSLLGLQFTRSKFTKNDGSVNKVVLVNSDSTYPPSENSESQVELGLVKHPHLVDERPSTSVETGIKSLGSNRWKYKSIKCLSYVVLCYLLAVHVSGYSLISLYIILVPSASQVLKNKGLSIQTFSVFTTVSTFANCGFTPTNENMMVFIKNSGFLLLLIPQILLGNILFPPCLRFVIWALERVTKREEFGYILKSHKQLGYDHLFSCFHSLCLTATVLGLILVQFILFCSMEWTSKAMDGLNCYQKLVGSLFQVVSSRHTGESVVDLSILSPAILVLFIVMMYLPPCTSVFSIDDRIKESTNEKKSAEKFVVYVLFSQLSYLAIFIMLICIIEREKMAEDPLNFNVLNITLEVVSAYGNVGFSTSYSCDRRLKSDSYCKDAWFGFAGRWSNKGKIILILVMFFGRLKKFTKNGGTAWKLS
ncbi:high-affinity K+ transporter 1 [Actinidia rufa]|uniref:High-affinity K+ transporter 1 n=1 Tax=Actinidia rufa TaxID=165716 RepID=A0A7J0E221_9ERIC|nr:high-affinity K+ transporter 1 [Actinidia rufa]